MSCEGCAAAYSEGIERMQPEIDGLRAALLGIVADNEKRGVRSAPYYRARRELGLKPGESALPEVKE